jgi:hypothetical protein
MGVQGLIFRDLTVCPSAAASAPKERVKNRTISRAKRSVATAGWAAYFLALRERVTLGCGGSALDTREVLLGVPHEAILCQALHGHGVAEEYRVGVELSVAQGSQ